MVNRKSAALSIIRQQLTSKASVLQALAWRWTQRAARRMTVSAA